MSAILVTGSSSGLGEAILVALARAGHQLYPYDRNLSPKFDVLKIDRNELPTQLDVLINCAGVNHQEWLSMLREEDWDRVMDTNAKALYKMTQACLPQLIRSQGTVLNITSNAAWVPMTCSAAYNASKGAAHILTQQMARELTRTYGITVFGIAPNKLRGTGMSKDIEEAVVRTRGWTPEFAEQYQKNALLTGEETDPMVIAEFVAYLLQSKRNHSQLSGCIIPYGA